MDNCITCKTSFTGSSFLVLGGGSWSRIEDLSPLYSIQLKLMYENEYQKRTLVQHAMGQVWKDEHYNDDASECSWTKNINSTGFVTFTELQGQNIYKCLHKMNKLNVKTDRFYY